MNSPDHIIIITPGFAADENDTLTIPPLQIFLKEYQKRYPSTEISIITLQYPFEEKIYKWYGIKVYSCGGKNKRGLAKFRTWRMAEKYFKEISKNKKPDLIHSFWINEAAGLGNHFAKKIGIKHIVTLMGQDACSSNRYLKLLDLQYPQLVCLSTFHKEVFKQNYYNAEPKIIPWGIDPNEFTFQQRNRLIDILGAGSLIPLKQFDLFIKIIEKAKEQKSDIKAAIAGAGPEKAGLEKMIFQSGLTSNIELVGQLPRPNLLQLMYKSKILLHTSHYESQGYVLLEALAAGMEVVSTSVSIAGEVQCITTGDTEEQLKNAILKKVTSEQHQQQKIPFNIEETVNAYQQLYTK